MEWFRSVSQGRDFKIVQPPAAPTVMAAVAPQPAPVPEKAEPLPVPSPEDSVAWRTDTMEEPEIAEAISTEAQIEIPDVMAMTVKEVRRYDWSALGAELALKAEQDADVPRKSVIKHLERIVDGA